VVYDYTVDGQSITLSFVTSTRNACMGADGQLASHISQVLDGAVTYAIDAQRLTLMNGDIGLGATTD
jgi:heat shock protein HslJ